MGDLLYSSFREMNLGVVNSGAGFLVNKIGINATEINKETKINRSAAEGDRKFTNITPKQLLKYKTNI
jgi:hypothetical protein